MEKLELMPKNLFVFQKFQIYQPYKDVMKVSTDSVLLGCFANVQSKQNALDIGCGSGILSLMIAQKNPTLKITAIDINENSYKCAQNNINNSPFHSQITVIYTSLKNYLDQSKIKFDTILCNPPYFSQSLKSPNKYKNIYRHQEELTYEKLTASVAKLLSHQGSFYTIIPYHEKNNFIKYLSPHHLYIHKELAVFSTETKKHSYLFIYEIKTTIAHKIEQIKLYIHNKKHQYTQEYMEITKEFYLYTK